jgi:hypothetical protein
VNFGIQPLERGTLAAAHKSWFKSSRGISPFPNNSKTNSGMSRRQWTPELRTTFGAWKKSFNR